MSTIKENPSPVSPQPTPPPASGNSKYIPILAVALIALLALAGYLFYQNNQLKEANAATTVELNDTETLRRDVEKQYFESLAELEEMRGSNTELNALIDAQKAELTESKSRIDNLMRDKRNLGAARKELAELRDQTAAYLVEIQQLREENGLLAEQNVNLTSKNEGLERTVVDATAANQELSTARAALMSEKDVLVEQKNVLSNTVTMASVVKVGNVDVTGLRMKENGKTVRKKYAKNVDLLNVCFETTQNDVTKPGDERYHVRIINPLGETLAVEEMGSGTLTNALTKEQVRYTKAAEAAYENDVNEVCITWDTPVQLAKGDYGVEVYNKGYLAGQGNFRLK